MGMKTPVAVFTYNRPEHTRLTLDALSKCEELDACVFYFFSDGPRSDDVRAEVEETRSILYTSAELFSAQVIEQPSNLGLAKSIVAGVSDLCERYGRVIVIEDDLIVSPDFLHFMIQSLDHYQDEPSVMQIGGFTISPPDDLTTDAFLLPVTTTWGWATWKRAWQHFAWTPKDLDIAKSDQKWLDLFNLHGAGSFSAMLEDRLAGRNDSWGILWWYAVSRSNGLVLYPRQSLVWNGGFDGTGIHCGSRNFLRQGDVSNYSTNKLPRSLSLPLNTEFYNAHLIKLENFLKKQQVNDLSVKCTESTKIGRLTKFAKQLKKRLKHVIC